MVRRGFFYGFLALFFIAPTLRAQWEQTPGPYGGATAIFADGGTILVGTHGSIFMTDDNGNSWREFPLSFRTPLVNSFVKTDSGYIAATNVGVYKFDPEGPYWVPYQYSPAINQFFYDGTRLWGASDNAVMYSEDCGATWNTAYSYGDFSFISIYVIDQTVFAGTRYNGIYRSTDYGATWEAANNGISETATIYAFTYSDNWLWVSVNGWAYRSDDLGETWQGHNSGLEESIYFLYSPADSYYIYAGTSDGVYINSFPVTSWSKLGDTDFLLNKVNSISSSSDKLFIAADGGVYFMDNTPFGSWKGMGTPNTNVVDFTSYGGRIVAATDLNGIRYTSDHGETWQPEIEGRSFTELTGVVSALAYTDTAKYIATSAGLYRRWQSDYHWWTTLNDYNLTSVVASGNTVYVGAYPGGVMVSHDGGQTWQTVNSGLPSSPLVRKFVIANNYLFAAVSSGTRDRVFRLDLDEASEWEEVVSGLGYSVLDIYEHNDTLYAGGFGFFVSTDWGEHWTEKDEGLIDKNIYAIYAIDNILLVGTRFYGVGISYDGGNTWNSFNDNFPYFEINAIIADNNYLYVGTNVLGVWRRPLSDLIVGVEENTTAPIKFTLYQNYPNPFNPTTTIKYSIPNIAGVETLHVTSLRIYNILGEEIATLVNERQLPGNYSVTFDASNLPSGVYFYTLRVGDFVATKKMILLK